jgi:hypothetical protein
VGQTRRPRVSPLRLSPSGFPPSRSVSRRPIWAGARGDNSLVGPGTPRGRNADNFKPSHRLKGNWSLRRRQRLPLHSIKLLILRRRSEHLSVFGIIFTHILFTKEGESSSRAYISLKYPFLAIHAKGGESISPKQKDRTTTNFQNLS